MSKTKIKTLLTGLLVVIAVAFSLYVRQGLK